MRHFYSALTLLTLTVVAILISVWLTGCAPKHGQDSNLRTEYSVSYPLQGELLSRIAGDSVNVTVLIPPGADPEHYEPSIQTLRSLENSRAYFTMGTPGFEEAILRKMSETLEKVDCASAIRHISGTHGDGETDPHIWNSVRNALSIASSMRDWLICSDPKHAGGYNSRYSEVVNHLTAIDDSIASILATSRDKTFVVMHPSLSYFARDYSLRQIAMETEGKEASPKQLADRMDEARRSGAGIMVLDASHPSGQAQTIARQLGLKTIKVSLNGEDWEKNLLTIAKAIADGK